MEYFKVILLSIVILLSGCSSSKQPRPISNHTYTYQQGYKDGCSTANGTYTKNHKLFNDNLEYHEGWFSGRRDCNH